MLEDKERIILQEKVFNAEEHLRNMCAAGGVSNNNAEVLNRQHKLVVKLLPSISSITNCPKLMLG